MVSEGLWDLGGGEERVVLALGLGGGGATVNDEGRINCVFGVTPSVRASNAT